MAAPVLTPALCRSAGQDAAMKQMRQAGRNAWSVEDFNLAAEVTISLMRKAQLDELRDLTQ